MTTSRTDRAAATAEQRRTGKTPGAEIAEIRADIEGRVTKARGWFDKVKPRHIDADQFIALCMGALHKDVELVRAAYANPEPFMVAVSECARLGLVPGTTYHFVAFESPRGSGNYEITGMVDYKGELDMIYRSGKVASVHFDVVRANDTFVWRRGMEIPHHVIHAPEFAPEQEGLAGDSLDDRGILTGVYAYARLLSGGFSEPVVMSKDAVMKRRGVAKTDKFWGKPWPDEGNWTPEMWIKTALHKLYDIVPHSAEYMTELLSMSAAVERNPITDLTPARTAPALPPGNGHRVTPGETIPPDDPPPPPPPPPGTQDPAGPAAPAHNPQPVREATAKIQAIFKTHGLGAAAVAGIRQAVITGMLAPEPMDEYAKPQTMTLDELKTAGERLAETVKGMEGNDDPRTVHDQLCAYADHITELVQQAQANRTEGDPA
jgi:recombination protein RecT